MEKKKAETQKTNMSGPEKSRSKPGPKDSRGCAPSFLNEEHGEMDPLCERTPEERQEEYVQPDSEKEDGGEG